MFFVLLGPTCKKGRIMHQEQVSSFQLDQKTKSEPQRINYLADKEFYETSIGMRLSKFSVQEFQQRESDGEIRTYYAVAAGCDEHKESLAIPAEAGKVENERDAVLAALSQLFGFNISINSLPPRRYARVASSRYCEVLSLPLAEFLESEDDDLPLFNLCPAYNEALARYAIFDPRRYEERKTRSTLVNWVNLYGRRNITTKSPCLIYCNASYYTDVGILGRQIDEEVFLPVIYNAKLVVISQDGEYDKHNLNEKICYLRYYPHTDPNVEYTLVDSCMVGTFNCMAHWYVVPDPGNYIDWQSFFAIYDSLKRSYQ